MTKSETAFEETKTFFLMVARWLCVHPATGCGNHNQNEAFVFETTTPKAAQSFSFTR